MHQTWVRVPVPPMKPPFDPNETIMSPRNAWCTHHWSRVVNDESINSVFAAFRLVTRVLEMDRFYLLAYSEGKHGEKTDVARINTVLSEISPICCWLGDDEFALLLIEAREINKPRSA